jgi:Mn2+/Fe2+ NRAMP family transporter
LLTDVLATLSGKHLAEHCRAEYPRKLSYALWLFAELAVTTADIPEG